MTQQYSLNHTPPGKPPFRLQLPDGTTRTDPEQYLVDLTTEELEAAGLVEALEKPAPDEGHRVEWAQGLWAQIEITAEELAAEKLAADMARSLTPARFAFLLAITGLEGVWTAMEAHTKANDLSTYAMLKAHSAAASYRLGKTLAILAQLKPMTDAIASGVDLSETTIRAAWAQAESVEI